jgi:transcriptional regulator with AAA-type ATPase domain
MKGWVLHSTGGGQQGIHWELTTSPVVLGEGNGRHVVVNDPEVDRPHCRLYARGEAIWIERLDGSDLLLLNGQPVRRAILQPGDTITLGNAVFTVSRRASAGESSPVARMVEAALKDNTPNRKPATANGDLAREAAGYTAALKHNPPNHKPPAPTNPPLSMVHGPLPTTPPQTPEPTDSTESTESLKSIQPHKSLKSFRSFRSLAPPSPQPPTNPPWSMVQGPSSIATPLLGDSSALREARDLIRRIAPTPLSVLITGETGTGKELAAQMLHEGSNRANGPFIAVNCAAIPEHLFESELFGHEKGAFTGADRKRKGKFDLAHGGTLFLDEIGDLSKENQARLLRVLEKGAYYPVGAEKESRANVRIIAATNKNLHHAMQDQSFRHDLYHRLAGIEIQLPPLRMRPSDIPILAQHFSNHYAQELGTAPKEITQEALDQLKNHPWPGNVRELKNTIERAAALSTGDQIDANDLDLKEFHPSPFTLHYSINATLSDVERAHIARVIDHCGGNISAAARMLGVHRNTLHNRIAEYAIRVQGVL